MSPASSNLLELDREHRPTDTSGFMLPPCSPVCPVVIAFDLSLADTSGYLRRVFHEFCNVIRVVCGLASAILREIFDEAAYERFLTRHRQAATVETYAAFCRENEGRNLRRPRCC